MKKIVVSILFILPVFSIAQKEFPEVEEAQEEVFEAVENSPVYPGGDSARQAFIVKNIVYPDSAIKHQREGKVYMKFVVEKDGSVSNVHSVKSFDDDCAAEAIRVTKMMRWIPGTQRGKAVRVWVVMPIVFRLY